MWWHAVEALKYFLQYFLIFVRKSRGSRLTTYSWEHGGKGRTDEQNQSPATLVRKTFSDQPLNRTPKKKNTKKGALDTKHIQYSPYAYFSSPPKKTTQPQADVGLEHLRSKTKERPGFYTGGGRRTPQRFRRNRRGAPESP